MSKITDNSNELSFHQLTSTSSMLLIPLFQRPYVWSQKQLNRMITELESIANEEDKSRFLGAVIAVTRPTNPSQPTPHEIVDGQQRLTTMYLFLLAAAQVAAREGKTDYARGLISTNLIVEWAQEIPTNTKLQPSIGDRGQFNTIFEKIAKTGDLADWLPVKMRLPSHNGNESGPLLKQYNRINKYLLNTVKDNGFDRLSDLVEAVRNSLTFVFILLKDPGSATTVFEGLNDPGVPISVGDLVKNEIFARVGYNEDEARSLHDHNWLAFREKFENKFDDFFFPFCIIHKPNVNRTEMFGELRNLWEGLNSKEIIENLDEFSNAYLALTGTTNPKLIYGKDIGEQIKRLIELRQPSTTYPFTMKLLKEFEDKKVSKLEVNNCLKVLESFLVRRAICGVESTGLLAMFRTMWPQFETSRTADSFAIAIQQRSTVEWPSDERLQKAIKSRPIYGSGIAKYVILEYDRAQGIDCPEIDDITIEHIMPASYVEGWCSDVTKNEHAKVKDLWANLIPVSQSMNSFVDQDNFQKKKKCFANESMFVSARKIGQEYNDWGLEQISHRSTDLADWAITRWKHYQSK